MWIILALSLAVLAVNSQIAGLLLAIAAVWAAMQGVVTLWMAILIIGIYAVAAFMPQAIKNRIPRSGREIVFLALAAGLILHWLPGFNNLRILNAVQAGPHSIAFTLYYNFDKALVPFVLLLALPGLFYRRPDKRVSSLHWLLLALSVPLLLLVALAAGGLRIEPHYPAWFWQFALANLFFVSLAEEALFRGYLQQRLMTFLKPWAALLVTAVIFGLMHYAGGGLMVIFASLAGVIYGLAWLWSGRVWVATLFHFALNILHLLLFTYPALQYGTGV